ncbi:hypothetical protein HY358_00380 [Candidatus Roizmanbacteria bacterium]|nr:hypothetical protein [Candidatus Roizmanbacteria bacterium]
MKKRNLSLYIISFLILATYYMLHATWVSAQQVSLSISPPLLEVFIKPGKTILVGYTVENHGDPVILKSDVRTFEPHGINGQIHMKDEFEGPIQFALDNADLELQSPFFLKTRDRQQLLLRIRVPVGTPEGDYYYSLLARSQPPPITEGITSSRAQVTIAGNILITVTESGNTQVKGKISLFDVLSANKFKIFDSFDKIPITLQVENKGKNMFKPEGEIVLKGKFGEKATYTIVPQNVLGESQRLLSATPSATIDCENQNNQRICNGPISLILSGFFLGKYTLSANVHFGEGLPTFFASAYFIVLPLKFMIVLFILLAGTVFIIRRNRS